MIQLLTVSSQGVIHYTRTENFCNKTYICNFFAGANIMPQFVASKNTISFSQMLSMVDMLCFGCFAAGQAVNVYILLVA